MNTPEDYTPSEPQDAAEHPGTTNGSEWQPVRVPGSEQGPADAQQQPQDDQPGSQHEADPGQVAEEFDAYEETTSG